MEYRKKNDVCICVSSNGKTACIGDKTKIEDVKGVYILYKVLDFTPKSLSTIVSETQESFPLVKPEETEMFLDELAEDGLIDRL